MLNLPKAAFRLLAVFHFDLLKTYLFNSRFTAVCLEILQIKVVCFCTVLRLLLFTPAARIFHRPSPIALGRWKSRLQNAVLQAAFKTVFCFYKLLLRRAAGQKNACDGAIEKSRGRGVKSYKNSVFDTHNTQSK